MRVAQAGRQAGNSVSASYLATLEDLAAKRRALADVIVALANLAGVDAAPYLDRPAAVTDDEVDTVVEQLRASAKRKAPAPPRPQSPAPRATNEAGHDDKVLHALRNGPLNPKAIAEISGIKKRTLQPVLARLVTVKRITKTGTGPRNTRYQLT